MAEGNQSTNNDEEIQDGDEIDPNYKIPEKKSMTEIIKQDSEDESLQRYKQQLLGTAAAGDTIFFPDDDRRVIVKRLTMLPADRSPISIDVSDKAGDTKKTVFVVKEGTEYQMEYEFFVQREIVTGLKCSSSIHKKALAGKRVDKIVHMMGSYGPREQSYVYKAPAEEAASGMLARGQYTVKCKFIDDDKFEHMKMEWIIDIKKEWES